MGCKICESPIGLEWTQMVQRGERELYEMAMEFKIPMALCAEHMEKHKMEVAVEKRQKFSEMIKDPDYLYDELFYILNKIKHWVDSLDDTDPDLPTIKAGTSLTKELRETLKFVGELEGKFNKGDTYHQQFIQIQGDYNQFTGMVLDAACPECQMKILKMIESSEK